MYIYIYIYIYKYIHILYIYIYTHVFIYKNIYIYTHIWIHIVTYIIAILDVMFVHVTVSWHTCKKRPYSPTHRVCLASFVNTGTSTQAHTPNVHSAFVGVCVSIYTSIYTNCFLVGRSFAT